MSQKNWNCLTAAALLTTALSTTLCYAEQPGAVAKGVQDNPSVAKDQSQTVTETPDSNTSPVQPKARANSSQAVTEAVIAKVYPHEFDRNQAATLYVRSIPVLTFISSTTVERVGNTSESLKQQSTATVSNAKKTAVFLNQDDSRSQFPVSPNVNQSSEDPLWRASLVADKINQLHRSGVNAETITVKWDARCNCYSIKVKEENLAEINTKTILADTTRNPASDALQATNRLRRLIGNAAPLQTIADRPQPKFQPKIQQVALVRTTIRSKISGMASWYSPADGSQTASGERLTYTGMTAAHRSLPFGTKVQVTNLNNGRSVVVRINDRGPFIRGRVIDLSIAPAKAIGLTGSGIAPVQVEVLNP